MTCKELGETVANWVHGNLASDKFNQIVLDYFESPDWHRRTAAQAVENLKQWRAGKDRLLELVEKARTDGYLVEKETVPLKDGHDSIIVRIEGGGTGFPSFMPPELVEEAFAEILAHAAGRRAQRIATQDHQMPER